MYSAVGPPQTASHVHFTVHMWEATVVDLQQPSAAPSLPPKLGVRRTALHKGKDKLPNSSPDNNTLSHKLLGSRITINVPAALMPSTRYILATGHLDSNSTSPTPKQFLGPQHSSATLASVSVLGRRWHGRWWWRWQVRRQHMGTMRWYDGT